MESKHTKGPWKVDGSSINATWENGEEIQVALLSTTHWTGRDALERAKQRRIDDESQANAAFIVQACNSHDALVEACKVGNGFICHIPHCQNGTDERYIDLCPKCKVQAALKSVGVL